MKKHFHSLILLFLLLLFPAFVFAQALDERLKEIDAYAAKAQKDWNVPGMAIAIVKDGKTVFAKGYGVQRLGGNDKVDENTLFAIASNSKAFTTASLAILIDEKKIGGWDDKVSDYLPEFQIYSPFVTEDLTIRDLVSHRVGLDTFSGDLLWYETTYSTDEILKRVRFLKPVRGFRAGFGYQNLMFMAAGRIIEKVSGKTWSEFVTERILRPIGMNRTTTTVKDIKENAAFPHNESGGKGLRALDRGNVDSAAAAAGLNSSVADISRWILLQLGRGEFEGKRIFSTKNSWEMWQPAVLLPISENSSKSIPSRHFNAYALGWNVWDYQGRKIIAHGGGLDGMISRTALVPEENLGMIILTNSENPVPTIMQYKILDVFMGSAARDWNAEFIKNDAEGKKSEDETQRKLEESRVLNTKTSLPQNQFAGTYSGKLYGDAVITDEGGKLVLRLKPAPNFVADLEHWHYDTFRIRWRPSVAYNFPAGFVTFTVDKNGRADELKIDQPNSDFWFYELEFKKNR